MGALTALGLSAFGGCDSPCQLPVFEPHFRVTVLETASSCGEAWLTLTEGEQFELVAGKAQVDETGCLYTSAAEPPLLADASLTLAGCGSVEHTTLGIECGAKLEECDESGSMRLLFYGVRDDRQVMETTFRVEGGLFCGYACFIEVPVRIERL